MKRIYITLAGRVDDVGESPEDAGQVVVLDWETKSVIKRILVTSEQAVKEGRTRGAGGIAWHEDFVYVACRCRIFAIDPDTYEVDHIINSGEPGPGHQIGTYENKLWVVCTGGDIKKSIVNREVRDIVHVGGGSPVVGFKDQLHFNSIAWDSAGDCYHLYMKSKKVVNYTTGKEVSVGLKGMPHDICFINENEFLIARSSIGELVKFNKNDGIGRVVFSKTVTNVGTGYRKIGFMRGLAFDETTNAVFVTTAPGKIYELDATSFKERTNLEFMTTGPSCTYDILLDPRDW